MQVKKNGLLAILTLFSFISVPSQTQDWRKLAALESNRADVEKITGKPVKYFDTFGIYRPEIGKFVVWYSGPGCQKGVEGLQWDVPAQKLTTLIFYPEKSLPLEDYISNKQDFAKTKEPMVNLRYYYTSPDETVVFETILPRKSKEFVYSIEIRPGKNKQHLLCNVISKTMSTVMTWILPLQSQI